jgi:hypothetical protein
MTKVQSEDHAADATVAVALTSYCSAPKQPLSKWNPTMRIDCMMHALHRLSSSILLIAVSVCFGSPAAARDYAIWTFG